MNFLNTLPLVAILLLSITSTHVKADSLLLVADRVFDGHTLQTGMAVLVDNDRITAVGNADKLRATGQTEIQLGNATLLPGFIESHAHLVFRDIPEDVVLQHGITTVRDLGGPMPEIAYKPGQLRILSTGPILTAPGAYPLIVFNGPGIAREVSDSESARQAVQELHAQGVSAIKIALEPGGEPGAPWSAHGHASHAAPAGHAAHTEHTEHAPAQWPMLKLETVRAIVEEAHQNKLKVIAHVGEPNGAGIALDAGVDEWAHVPCLALPDELIIRAAEQKISIVSTLDTLSACPGIQDNARRLHDAGVTLIYGSEIAHDDVPWGINAQELHHLQMAGLSSEEVLTAATALPGEQLGLAPLGTITPGAPADIIAVAGDALKDMKQLEYPGFVMAGGRIVINRF